MYLPSGTRLGPYRIEAPIGAGGMGEVYRAIDTRLKRDVAVPSLARDRESLPPSDPSTSSPRTNRRARPSYSHGVRKTVLHRGIRLFAAPQAIQPIDHVGGIFIAHPRRRKRCIASQQNVFDTSPGVNRGIIFVIALFLHHLPARAAFAAVIHHGGFLAHDARETGCVIAEAR